MKCHVSRRLNGVLNRHPASRLALEVDPNGASNEPRAIAATRRVVVKGVAKQAPRNPRHPLADAAMESDLQRAGTAE